MKTLAGQTIIYTIANVLSRGALVVALLVLPHLLDPADYGALGLIVTLNAFVSVVVPLEVSQGVARYHGTAEAPDKPLFAATAWWFTVMMLLVIAAVATVFAAPICRLLLGDLRYLDALRLSFAFMVLTALFYFLQGQCRWEFKVRHYIIISLIFSFLTLILSLALGTLLSQRLEGVLLGQVIGAAVSASLGFWLLRKSLPLRFDIPKLRRMLHFSLPLVPANIALFLSLYASRFILNATASLEEVGIYTFASQIAAMAGLIILGVQSALTPLVMAHHAKPETPITIARLFEGFTGVALCACLGLGLFSPELLRCIGTPAYDGAGPLVIVLAPAFLMLQMYIFAPGFAIAERTGLQMLVSVISSLTCVGANYLLIGRYGSTGAAFATLLSALIFLGLWFVLSLRFYPVPIRWGRVAAAITIAVGAGLGSLLVGFLSSVPAILGFKAALLAVAAASMFALRLFSPRILTAFIGPFFRRHGAGL